MLNEIINNKLNENKNISYFKDISEISLKNSFIFNSVPTLQNVSTNLWQHFHGIEVETKEKNNPSENNRLIIKKIVLSMFFHQS